MAHSPTGNKVSFDSLTDDTQFTFTVDLSWANGAKESLPQFSYSTYKTPEISPLAQKSERTRSLDVPLAAYNPSFYDIVIVHVGKDFEGDTNNLEFFNSASSSGVSKRSARTAVYIYKTRKAMYEAGADIAAYVAKTVPTSYIDRAIGTYEYDSEDEDFNSGSTYLMLMRGCNDENPGQCVEGSEQILTTEKDKSWVFVLAILLPILVIVVIIGMCACSKETTLGMWVRGMDPKKERSARRNQRAEGSAYPNQNYEEASA